jgi:hypothetical protein
MVPRENYGIGLNCRDSGLLAESGAIPCEFHLLDH